MQKLKDFVVEEDGIFHKGLDYSIKKDNDLGWSTYYHNKFDQWFCSLELAVEYVLKQVEESSK